MTHPITGENPMSENTTERHLEAIAHNLCSLHDFDPAFVAANEKFARAVITEYQRATLQPAQQPQTAADITTTITRWLEADDPTHWGEFERALASAVGLSQPAQQPEAVACEGWTGKKCPICKGTGERSTDPIGPCPDCGGTGDEYGPFASPPARKAGDREKVAWPEIPDQRTRGHPLVEIVREAHDAFLAGAARPTDDSAAFIARRILAALTPADGEG